MKRNWLLLTTILLFSLILAACATAPATEAPAAAPPAEEEAPPAEEMDVVSWFQYDQNNEDPASDERVGNEYLRNTIPQFDEAFEGQWNWVNQPKAFDKMTTELVAAVQAGGDVPDIFELSNTQDLIDFYRNGTAQDQSEWAQTQPWWGDLDQSSINACTGPDGKLYCVPISIRPQLVYVWNDRFPDGYPTTPEEFMTEAERLKGEGLYAMTFFGSTDKGGEGLTRAVWTIIDSFGGVLDDGQGNMKLDSPETISAIEFLREMVAKEYVPEIAFAGGFQEEEAFKDSSAGSFPTGLFGYRYVNPLTAPNGTKYETGSSEDMINAIEAGDVYLAPSFAAAGQQPGCGIDVQGFVIPVGAENVDGAHDFITWMMTSPEQNAAYVIGPGGGFPTLKATQTAADFQTMFYEEAGKAIDASDCTP